MQKTDIQLIERHLNNKGTYRRSYIDRVCQYMERNPDLAREFRISLPKNEFPEEYISVRGTTAKDLGLTALSHSAIYVTLARIREEPKISKKKIIEEESLNLKYGKIK